MRIGVWKYRRRAICSVLLAFILAVLVADPPNCQAQPGGSLFSQLELLDQLAKALGAAAQSIGQLGAEFGYLATLTTCGYDAVEARNVKADLNDISARVANLTA